jgi:hypothetical protein
LCDPEVGKFLNEHFAAGFQKVGTFKIVNGVKTGGNVATYFCTADGRVLHAIAGPVDGRTLLAEGKWVLDIHEKAKKAADGKDADYVKLMRQAHAERLKKDSEKLEEGSLTKDLEKALAKGDVDKADDEFSNLTKKLRSNELNDQEKKQLKDQLRKLSTSPLAAPVHRLLATQALDNIEQVYTKVWEGILKEKVSNDPVKIQGYRP